MNAQDKRPAPSENEHTNALETMLNSFGFNISFQNAGTASFSTPEELKNYFLKIMELKQKGEQFPVDLDDVWPLVYSEKGKAVRALKDNALFMEGIDYQYFAQNGKLKKDNGTGHRLSDTYKISVQCLEYFIVRKKRNVFEVYRQIFHAVAEGKFQRPRKNSKGVARLPYNEDEKKVLQWISENLIQGDYDKISKGCGYSASNISLVLNGKHINEKIVKEAYRVALDNHLQSKKQPDSIYGKDFIQDCLSTINLFNYQNSEKQ